MTLRDIARKIFFLEILKGLALTFRTMISHPVTRRYPKVKRDPFPGFRGRHAFVRDPATGREKCVACAKCSIVCPSQGIRIAYTEEAGKRRPQR